jgi:hypothetical protein
LCNSQGTIWRCSSSTIAKEKEVVIKFQKFAKLEKNS